MQTSLIIIMNFWYLTYTKYTEKEYAIFNTVTTQKSTLFLELNNNMYEKKKEKIRETCKDIYIL